MGSFLTSLWQALVVSLLTRNFPSVSVPDWIPSVHGNVGASCGPYLHLHSTHIHTLSALRAACPSAVASSTCIECNVVDIGHWFNACESSLLLNMKTGFTTAICLAHFKKILLSSATSQSMIMTVILVSLLWSIELWNSRIPDVINYLSLSPETGVVVFLHHRCANLSDICVSYVAFTSCSADTYHTSKDLLGCNSNIEHMLASC